MFLFSFNYKTKNQISFMNYIRVNFNNLTTTHRPWGSTPSHRPYPTRICTITSSNLLLIYFCFKKTTSKAVILTLSVPVDSWEHCHLDCHHDVLTLDFPRTSRELYQLDRHLAHKNATCSRHFHKALSPGPCLRCLLQRTF